LVNLDVVFLLVFLVAREILYQIQIQKLLNKLMSRNYNEYVYTNSVTKKTPVESLSQGIKEEQELEEDLSPVNGFGMN